MLTERRDWVQDWPRGWTARSLPYRQAFHRAYYAMIDGASMPACPFLAATVEFDAWFAGQEAGKLKFKIDYPLEVSHGEEL